MKSVFSFGFHATAIPLLLVSTEAWTMAADQAPADPSPTGNSDQTLLKRIESLEQQLSSLRSDLKQTDATTSQLNSRLEKQEAESHTDNAFSFGGYGLFDATMQKDVGHSMTAQFQPIFAYSYREEFLFIGEMNLDTTGTTELTQAYMAYTNFSHVIVEVGKFPLPFAAYSERLSPAWVNKFSDSAPAPYDEDFGLFASDQADIGAQIRGDIPLSGNAKINYVAFLTSGPSYNATDGSDDRLSFASNTGTSKVPPTIGGRIGFLPMPSYEIGVSAMTGHINNNVESGDPANPAAGGNIKVLYGNAPMYDRTDSRSFSAYAVDGEYHSGGFVLRGELIKVDFDDSTNERVKTQGGYAQASQRLTFLSGWASALEPTIRGGAVVRTQALLTTGDDGSGNTITVESRRNVQEVGLGLNYYFSSYIRSSLFVLGHNDHDLDRVTFTTTFAF
jgi:hypothetical protein